MIAEKIKNPERFNAVLTEEILKGAAEQAMRIMDKDIDEFFGYDKFPSHNSTDGYYDAEENDDGWNTGFWSGMLWLGYELSGNEKFRKAAETHIDSFYERIDKKLGVNHHDMGFLYTPSCVAAYKLTGNEKAKEAAIMAAKHLITRFNDKAQFIQAWGDVGAADNFRLIIDCMLNIPLLYWAYSVTGDKELDEKAYKHYKTTISNIFREDGSSYHTYFFDKDTGKPIKGVTHQGWADDSCWARGQAWGIYGLALTNKYHFTEESVPTFEAVLNFFANRLPKDNVPYWDMIFTDGDMARDSSAAAIAICGILEMIKYIKDEETVQLYKKIADTMMLSLIENYAVRDDDKSNGLLKRATYHYKGGIGVDECNIWGDYFYMEALTRYLKKDWELYW
ncbi:MAG: glycoside hydrolase family 88 protein [Clostridia bacterium]|nr:glycoside hydrolase family 88 protein [Clostridia bacterium]